MISESGRVKVLDFGLAKVTDSDTPKGNSELATEMHTRDGVVMGTNEAKEIIRQALQVQPALSLGLVRKSFGAIAPDVDRRMGAALLQAGMPEA